MKNLFQLLSKHATWVIPAMLLGISLSIISCKKDENKPAPSVTVTPGTTSNLPGAKVTTSVSVNAPAGGKTLTILVNGAQDAALPNVDLAGATSKSVNVEYTIPTTAVIGATILISFQASDNDGQNSVVSVFTVTVSATPSKQIVEVSGTISTDTKWTSDKIYRLNGFVRVGKDEVPSGGSKPEITQTAVLTIEPGTVILGKTGTPGGGLIIQRGSKIIAEGTAAQPIIFTSEKAPGSRKGGDWSGLVICGQAPTNIAAGYGELEGGYGAFFGGTNADDNSGVLKYVRVEYAGYPINPNQEINGLTFGGVGRGTTVQYIQVAYANDDSYEWFGGTVNCKNLVAYKGIDDDFDTDNGFSGNVQFGVGIRDAQIADQSGSNGFEADNDATGSANTPFTSPKFSNMTMIGPKYLANTTISLQFQNGAHLRRNVKQSIINSFITGYPTGIFIDGTAGTPTNAVINAANGELVLKGNVLAGVQNWGGNGFGSATSADEKTIAGLPYGSDANHAAAPRGRIIAVGAIGSGSNPFINGVFTITDQQVNSQNAIPWFLASNIILSKWNDANINASVFEPLNGAPTFIPGSGSALLSGADFSGFTGFENVSYKGAFGTTDWTQTWTNWNPQVTDYTK